MVPGAAFFGSVAVDRVKAFRLQLRQAAHAGGDDRQAGLLESTVNLADEVASHPVGLDDGQSALERHSGTFQKKAGYDGSGLGSRNPGGEPAAKCTLGELSRAMHGAPEVPV